MNRSPLKESRIDAFRRWALRMHDRDVHCEPGAVLYERRRVEGKRVKIMARCSTCMAEWFCTVPIAMAQDEGLVA